MTLRPARAAEYTSRSWHYGDGLPGEEIVALTQDARGFLWVATTAGLARFDGMHFEPYRVSPDRRTYTRVLATIPGLGLLAALPGGGMMQFGGHSFHPLPPPPLGDSPAQTLFVAPDHALWIMTASGALWRRAPDGTVANVGRTLTTDGPRSLASDARGNVWLAAKGFVARYASGHWVRWPGRFGGAELHLGSSTRGGPWLVTQDHVLRLRRSGAVDVVAAVPPLVSAHYVHTLVEDHDGDLWIGTRSQGLFVVSGHELRPIPTSQEEVTALCCDGDGNIWVGTNGGGLDRIRRKSYRLYDTSSGLLQNLVYSVCADPAGNIWVANRDGGVARIHDSSVQTIVAPTALPALSAISLFHLPDGAIAVTGGTGIFRLPSAPGGAVTPIAAIPRIPIVRVTFTARNGDIWFSVDPDRIGRLRGGAFVTFGPAQGMTGRRIRAFAEDGAGRIWVGTTDGRLFRQAGRRFEPVPLDGIPTGAINAIHLGRSGTLWLGTVRAGIVGLIDGRARSCSIAQGLPDENIALILPDRLGHFWCGSKRGIFRVDRRELLACLEGRAARVNPIMVGQEDGLRNLSCSSGFQPGACRGPDGTLWFATRRGVLAIDPTKPAAAPPPPPVDLEEVRFDDRRVPLRRPLVVGPDVHKLELRFGVLSLSAPDRVVARYRLEGFDSAWTLAGPSRLATYPRLPPGRYLFQVTARNADTASGETRDALAIVFLPRWWETWWFRLGLFAGGTAGIAGLARFWSNRRLRRRLERLERETAVERERTRIAQNIHDDVGASLTRISLLAQHGQHEVRGGAEFFDAIYGTATEITRSLDEIVWAVNPRYDNIESLANYLGNFAQRFLDVARLRCRLDMPHQLPPIPLASDARHQVFLCFKEALHNVVKHAHATAVQIALHLQAGTLVISVRDDGRGIAPAAESRPDPNRAATGNGLDNLRQRMARIGGTCDISSPAEGGTLVTFTLPVPSCPAGTIA